MQRGVRFWIVTVAAMAALATTTALGLWQWGRAETKRALLAQQQAQRDAPPLDWDEVRGAAAQGQLDALHGRAVRLRGRWVHEATVYLDNRPLHGQGGFVVVTPLLAPGGTAALLVQRGWVPRDPHDRTRVPALDEADAEVEVEGRLAPLPSRLFELGPDARGPIRQNIDVAAAAAEWRLPLLQASVQQLGQSARARDGTPLVREWAVVAVPPEKHLAYAAQWFALAGLIAGLYVWFQLILPRRRRR